MFYWLFSTFWVYFSTVTLFIFQLTIYFITFLSFVFCYFICFLSLNFCSGIFYMLCFWTMIYFILFNSYISAFVFFLLVLFSPFPYFIHSILLSRERVNHFTFAMSKAHDFIQSPSPPCAQVMCFSALPALSSLTLNHNGILGVSDMREDSSPGESDFPRYRAHHYRRAYPPDERTQRALVIATTTRPLVRGRYWRLT